MINNCTSPGATTTPTVVESTMLEAPQTRDRPALSRTTAHSRTFVFFNAINTRGGTSRAGLLHSLTGKQTFPALRQEAEDDRPGRTPASMTSNMLLRSRVWKPGFRFILRGGVNMRQCSPTHASGPHDAMPGARARAHRSWHALRLIHS